MVQLDVTVGQVVHLYDSDKIKKEKVESLLAEFKKEDLIEHILEDIESDDDDDDDDDDEIDMDNP